MVGSTGYRRGMRGRAVVAVCAGIIPLLRPVGAEATAWWWVGPNGGNWNTVNNWSNGFIHSIPLNADDASITLSPTAAYAVIYNGSYDPGLPLNSLTLNSTSAYSLTLYQAAAVNLFVSSEYVGTSGQATHNQSAGINGASLLYLGNNAGSTGTYSLSGTGTLSSGTVYVGNSGLGTFAQSGGSATVSSGLWLGFYAGANASYTLSGGSLKVTGAETVSYDNNTCIFSQSGTSSNSAANLRIAAYAGSKGSYNLAAGSLATTGYQNIGEIGAGTMTQSGGTNSVGGGLYISPGTSSTGTYNLSGASSVLNVAGNVSIGANGNFNWTSGSFNWTSGQTMSFSGGGAAHFTPYYDFPSSSTVNIDGAGSGITGSSMDVRHGTTVNVSSGGYLGTTSGGISIGTNGSGTVVVDGTNSTFASGATTYVGLGASSGTLTLSHNAAGTVGSSLQFANDSANASTNGTLNIESGADLSVTGAISAAVYGLNGQYGVISVTGMGSTLTQTGTANFILGANTNMSGTAGQLAVTDNASVTAGNLSVYQTGYFYLDGSTASFTSINVIGGHFSFSSGSLSTGGNFVIGQDSIPSQVIDSSRSLTVGGTTSIFAPYYLHLNGGSFSTGAILNWGDFTFTSGILSITGAGGLSFSSASSVPLGSNPVLTSAQTLNVTNMTSILSSAVLSIDGGRLNATGGLTNSGELDLLSSPSRITGGTLTNAGLVRGDGRIDNNLTNNAGGEVRAESGKSLVFRGATNASFGRISLLGGTVDFSGSLVNNAAAVISGHGTLLAGTLSNYGQIQLSGGNSDVFATLTNYNASKVIVSGGATATFYKGVTNSAGSEFRVSTGSTAVFFGPVVGGGLFTGPGIKDFEVGVSEPTFLATNGATIVDTGAGLSAQYLREASLDNYGAVTIRPAASGGNTSVLQAMMLHAGSSMDLADNKLVWDYTGSSATLLDSMRSWIHDSLLNSSTAAADPQHRMGLAYGDNALLGKTTWGGQAVDPTSILVKLSWLGDANLDGKINADDYALLDLAAARHVANPHWTDGDFNSDGAITSADYLLIDRSMALQSGVLDPGLLATREAQFGPAYVAALVASVPEPGVAGVLAAGCPCLLRRRRRG